MYVNFKKFESYTHLYNSIPPFYYLFRHLQVITKNTSNSLLPQVRVFNPEPLNRKALSQKNKKLTYKQKQQKTCDI